MKKFYLAVFFVFFGLILSAQDDESMFRVKRFELIPNDTEASRAMKKDANGDKCALIKIKTPNMNEAERDRIELDSDRGTFLYPEKATGEIKLFLTYGCKLLVIKHPDYGTMTYRVPIQIEANKTYKLVLEVMKENPVPAMSINSNWVVVKVTPADAIINIDGNFCANGSTLLSTGEAHELEITHPLYHPYEKDIYADADKTLTYDVKLEPAFGWLKIDTKPESGATVLLNGMRKGTTPFLSDTLVSGEYEVTLLLDMYKNVTKTLVVRDNNVAEIDIKMSPVFAEVSLTTDKDADIYIDDKKAGTGTWKGRLIEGQHKLEARKESHRSVLKAIDITAGKSENIALGNPIPIYGAINVNSTPIGASVFIDGVKKGNTPMIVKEVLIGNREVRIEEPGYDGFSEIVNVKTNEMSSVSTTLVEGYSYNAAADASSFGGEGIFMPAFLPEQVNRDMKKNGRKTKDPLYSTTKKSMKDAVVGLALNKTPRGFYSTGTIVSEKGLLLTNYFKIRSLIDYISDEEYNYNNGFWAADYYEEVPVKRLTASFLVRTEDVTSEILNITTEKIEDKIKKKEKEASENGKYVAVINSAYGDTKYYMQVYKTYTDVRLVGLPPTSINYFGGDSDNYMWPRYYSNFVIFRVYGDAKGEPAEYSKSNVPLNTKNHFTISLNGVKPGDFSMVLGFAQATSRQNASSYYIDLYINMLSQEVDFERKRQSVIQSFIDDNSIKEKYADELSSLNFSLTVKSNQIDYLNRSKAVENKAKLEKQFQSWVEADAGRKAKYGDLSNNLNNTYKEITQHRIDADYISLILNAEPVDFAGDYSFLIEDKNNGVNKEYPVDVQFANFDMRVEKKMLYEYLLLYKEHFKDNIPEAIKNQLKKHKGSWETYANFIVDNSIFSKPKTWKEFIEKPSSSKLEKDPAYVLYAALESQRKEIYSSWPDKLETYDNLYIQGFMEFYSDTKPEKILYPDADYSLRVSYGPVSGYVSMDGKKYSHVSTSDGIIKNYNPNEPDYTVPQSFLNILGSKDFGRYADEKGNLITCFITQTDILDLSEGSAVLNGKGELTGITADGNWDSCINRYIYKQDTQRTVCSDIRYILFLIDKYAGAKNVINELDIH